MSFESLRVLQTINEQKSRVYREYFRAKRTRRNQSVVAPPELRDAYFTAAPYIRLACQVINERIDLNSVTAETPEATAYLQKMLAVNGGSDLVASAHLSAMEMGRAYLVPSGSDRADGLPMVAVRPASHIVHTVDPYTGEIQEALQVIGPLANKYVYYTPGRTVWLEAAAGTVDAGAPEGWRITRDIPNDTGRVAIFPLVCRGEPGDVWGRPEGKDAFTLQDTGCRILTDMAIASGTMATPKQLLIGAEASDFGEHDPDGNPVPGTEPSSEELYMSRLLTISDPLAKIAEFSAAQIQNFSTGLNTTTRMVSAVLGVPQSAFGVASDANPASGDAIAQDDKRVTRRAEQLTRGFEPGWKDLFTYILENSQFGAQEVTLNWYDPGLPNLSSRADSVLKLSAVKDASGQPLYTWQELRRLLGDSDAEIQAAESQREIASVQNLLNSPGAAGE